MKLAVADRVHMNFSWDRFFGFAAAFFLLTAAVWGADGDSALKEIRTEPGAFQGAKSHVQGICCNEDAIYLAFTNHLYKIDWSGRLLASAEVPEHSGDPCWAEGHLYVSMASSDGKGVYEYDADLRLVQKFTLEKAGGTDGIAYLNGSFYIGGPSMEKPHTSNLILQYDRDFNLIQEHHLDFGVETNYGPQSMTAWNGSLLFAFYTVEKAPYRMVRTDAALTPIERYVVNGSNGIDLAPASRQGDSPRFIIARTQREGDETIAVLHWFELKDGSLDDITVDGSADFKFDSL